MSTQWPSPVTTSGSAQRREHRLSSADLSGISLVATSIPHWGAGQPELAKHALLNVMIAFAVLIVLAITYLWRNLEPGRKPLDILNERFARGEIDREEYENRRQALSSS